MGFIEGDARRQGTLFPVTLEEFIPDDHFCRVIDVFVDGWPTLPRSLRRVGPETPRLTHPNYLNAITPNNPSNPLFGPAVK